MKKTNKPLKLSREHIRLLTPTDLKVVIGGAPDDKPTVGPTISDNCSNRVDDTCGVYRR